MNAADPAAEPALRLRLFGPFEATVSGRPLPPLHSRRSQWLLALLTLRPGQEVARDWLAGVLWPDSGEAAVLANLRQSLTDLRRALGAEAWRIESPTRQTLRLDLSGADVDVLAFDRAARERRGDIAALDAMVALYRGPLLEGCTEEWLLPERAAREQAYLSALEHLAHAARERNDPDTAIGCLRRVLAVDPLRESAQRGLMECLAAGGSWAAALAQYRDLRLLLRREMNAEPDPETVALFERLRRDRASGKAAAPRAASMAPPPAPLSPAERRGVRSAPLPVPLTELFGREASGREALGLLGASRSSRLVTLIGIGGVGKTRLALAVAETAYQERPGDFPDGVWFADLSALSSRSARGEPWQVPEAVARALGVTIPPGRDPADALTSFLASRSLLLVLDNCEHLLDAVAPLAESLLSASPGLCVLATSRERLGLLGETLYHVPPLPAPDPEALTDAAPEAFPSVALFVARARAASGAGFALSEGNARDVARICARLDGIPLAIELAAARVRTLSPGEIAERLDDRFRLLTGGSRTALPRQRTLRATLDWSWELLSEEERALLSCLSVFAGGWTLEAAEAVAPAHDTVLDPLTDLVEKSLVLTEADERAGGRTRCRLLETVRQYARDRLSESGEAGAAARARHRDFFLALAEEAEPHLGGPERAGWLTRLETEYENLRTALESYRTTEGHTEQQLRLAGALREFWSGQGHWTEGREWAEEALRQSGAEIPAWVRAKAHAMVGTLAWEQARYATAVPHLEQNLSLRREIGDRPGIADALRRLGSVLREQGGFAVARAHFEEALAISREADDRTGVAWSLHALGTVAHYERDNVAARRLYEAAAAMRQELGDPDIAWTLSSLGSLAYREGDYAAARAHFARSLALFRESSDRYGIVLTLKYCGWLAAAQGQARRAIPLLGAMHGLSEPLGMSLPLVERAHHDRILGAARAVLGEAAFAAAWAEGTALELEQAVAYALDGEGEASPAD